MGADAKRKRKAASRNASEASVRYCKTDGDSAEPATKRFCLAANAPKAFSLVEKSRRTRPSEPTLKSPVVLVRGLPESITTADLIDSLFRFGPIAYVKTHPKQGWAFVEFENEQGSEACVRYGHENAVCIGDNEVFMMYSLHHILDRDVLERREPNKVILMSVSKVEKTLRIEDVYCVCSTFGEVQRIKISSMSPRIESDVLVFVEYDNTEAAREAKLGMNGAYFFEGCNLIHCEYASLERLDISEDNENAHDYTRPVKVEIETSRECPAQCDSSSENNNGEQSFFIMTDACQLSPESPPPSAPSKNEAVEDYYVIDTNLDPMGSNTQKDEDVSSKSSVNDGAVDNSLRPIAFTTEGNASPVKAVAQSTTDSAAAPDIPLSSTSQVVAAPVDTLVSSGEASQNYEPNSTFPTNSTIACSGQPKPLLNIALDHGSLSAVSSGENISANTEGPRCMMIYGLELRKGLFTCDRIFNIMCMYGHVIAIKLVIRKQEVGARKKDAAIVEYAHPSSIASDHHLKPTYWSGQVCLVCRKVNIAMSMLRNLNLFGCALSFDYGRNETIRLTTEKFPNGMPMCEVYTACPLQRFKRYFPTESSSRNRITAPTSLLYWWDAPFYTTKEMIYSIFVCVGAPAPNKVIPFKPGPSGSVGLVEFETSQQAAEALLLANHFPMLLPGFRGPWIVKFTFASSKSQHPQCVPPVVQLAPPPVCP